MLVVLLRALTRRQRGGGGNNKAGLTKTNRKTIRLNKATSREAHHRFNAVDTRLSRGKFPFADEAGIFTRIRLIEYRRNYSLNCLYWRYADLKEVMREREVTNVFLHLYI